MDKKFNEDLNKEEIDINELLDFLDQDSTYFVEDNESGVVGNKKTGVMLDKRTGKVFSSDFNLDSNFKYDFLEYKKSIDVLKNLDEYKSINFSEKSDDESSKKGFKVKNKLGKNINIMDLKNKFIEGKRNLKKDEEKDLNKNTCSSFDVVEIKEKSDEDMLNEINKKFSDEGNRFYDIKKDDLSDSFYNFSSFEDDELNQKKNEPLNFESDKKSENNVLDKFRVLMDFEEYLSNIPSNEDILDSPFDESEVSDIPKVIIEEGTEDDFFSPFDELNAFEVEEIQSYEVESNSIDNNGIIPDLNLNQVISRKVSIREIIKNKQKKKQEQKEIQEKLFFETLDERIEQFKKFKEHNIDSQEILNAINMDLNKINSSIRVEFESLRKKKFNKKSSDNTISAKKDDKFSLHNLLEEIYEENGEKPSSLDINELDIDLIKKDLAKKENNKNIVN